MAIADVRPVPVDPETAAGTATGPVIPVRAGERASKAPFEAYGHIAKLFSGAGDHVAQGFIDALISAKATTLFSFLFGLGFAVQMSPAEERGRLVSFYPQRLGILLAIGLIHGWLIWVGDTPVC